MNAVYSYVASQNVLHTFSCGFSFSNLQEEKQKHDGESREHRDSRRPVEEVRHRHGDRERVERDKHKERRHREEEEPERRQRQEEREPDINHRTSSKKSDPSDKSYMHKTNAVETEVSSTKTFHYLWHLSTDILSKALNHMLGAYSECYGETCFFV